MRIGKYPLWAVTAAFGGNLNASAEKLAATLDVNDTELEKLKNLGMYINYNGYGSSVADLHFAPDVLYREMGSYVSPFDFISENGLIFAQLEDGYQEDMAKAGSISPQFQSTAVGAYLLSDEAWARRVSGVFGNHLANQDPTKAHAVLSYKNDGGYLISVRAALNNKMGADELCSGFATGGGRKSAAGISYLPKEQLGEFIERFDAFYAAKMD